MHCTNNRGYVCDIILLSFLVNSHVFQALPWKAGDRYHEELL